MMTSPKPKLTELLDWIDSHLVYCFSLIRNKYFHKHLGVPVDDLAYHSVELPSEEPNFIPLLRKTKGASDK